MTVAGRPPGIAAGLLSVEEALAGVLGAIGGPLEEEVLAPLEGLGRVLGAPVVSTTDLPPWDNSAMDGYAVVADGAAEATEGAPVRLRVVGDAPAGRAAKVAVSAPDEAIRIATGSPVPLGADAVVPVELTTPLEANGVEGPRGRHAGGPLPAAILVHTAVPRGGSIRQRGDDLRAGSVVLEPGQALTPAGVALAAGVGASTVSVHRRPLVGVLATGDEVRSAGQPLGAAGIPDANGPGLRALVTAAGGRALDLGIAPDRRGAVQGAVTRGIAAGADAIVVSGGVSVGPFDVVKLAFEALGRIDLWRVAIQPGKPFAFGVADRPAGGPPVLLFGLPGNPVSSAVTFELFVRPALRRLAGHRTLGRPRDRAVLEDGASKSHGRRSYLRVVTNRAPDGAPIRDDRGRLRVRLAGGQGSHVLSALAAADGLAVIPEAVDRVEAGTEVELLWLDAAD